MYLHNINISSWCYFLSIGITKNKQIWRLVVVIFFLNTEARRFYFPFTFSGWSWECRTFCNDSETTEFKLRCIRGPRLPGSNVVSAHGLATRYRAGKPERHIIIISL